MLELDILADALHHYSNIAEIHIVDSCQKFCMKGSWRRFLFCFQLKFRSSSHRSSHWLIQVLPKESAIHIRQSKAESGPTIRLSLRDTAILDGPRAFPDSLTFDSFVKRLNFNSSLRKVSLPNCKIGDGETHFIALALRSNRLESISSSAEVCQLF